MQITATRHLTTGLGFLAGYTWSKTLGYNDAVGPATTMGWCRITTTASSNALSRSSITRAASNSRGYTRRRSAKAGTGISAKLNYVLGGWELSAIHNYRSGDPLYVYSSGLNVPGGFAPNIRPDIISGVPLTLGGAPTNVDLSHGTPYINPAAFQNVPSTGNGVPLRVGTAPRIIDGLRGPHFLSEAFRMAKKFPITGTGDRRGRSDDDEPVQPHRPFDGQSDRWETPISGPSMPAAADNA